MNSVLYINESASTTLGLTLSHPVKLRRHRGTRIVAHTSPVYTTAKANRRQLIADKGSFDGGLYRIFKLGIHTTSEPDQLRATFRAALTERCFRYLDCFDCGVPHPTKGGMGRAEKQMQAGLIPVGRSANVAPVTSGTTLKAVYLSSRVDRSQLRMSEDSNLMCNQNQALTPPVNLVGGAVMCEPYLPLVGPKPPCKGGSYA